MSLNNMKVGDCVLIHLNGVLTTERVKYVGAKTFRTDTARSYYKSTGCESNGGIWQEHYRTVWRIATVKDVAATAQRQQEQEERRERAINLCQTFGVMFDSKSCEGDLITIEHRGHRYEIREIEGRLWS
jgi:hypothetical protein